jgi:hypothetical protein
MNLLDLPEDFYELLPKVAEVAGGPVYYLWVFDPATGTVRVENTDGVSRANQQYHLDLAQEIPHPSRIHGYAYPIRGGYRITDWEHKPVVDPFVKHQVVRALDGQGERPVERPGHFAQRVINASS